MGGGRALAVPLVTVRGVDGLFSRLAYSCTFVHQELKLLERQNSQLQESLTRTSAAADRATTRAREAEERVHNFALSVAPSARITSTTPEQRGTHAHRVSPHSLDSPSYSPACVGVHTRLNYRH